MLEDIKFRSVVYLEKLCNLSMKSNDIIKSELSNLHDNGGYISNLKRRVIVERIPCEFNIISDGFILFGSFGSIYGKFDKTYCSSCENRLSIYINNICYNMVFKNSEDLKKVNNILSEMSVNFV